MGSIEQVGPEFAERLVELWINTFVQAYSDVHSTEDIESYCAQAFTRENAMAYLSDDAAVCAAYFRDERPTGLYILTAGEPPIELPGGALELKHLYVLADEYGSGAGQELFDDACRMTKSLGHACLWLAVSTKNHRAQRFYAKNGFKTRGPGPVLEVGTDRLTSSILTLQFE